jgi:hypothetical protein
MNVRFERPGGRIHWRKRAQHSQGPTRRDFPDPLSWTGQTKERVEKRPRPLATGRPNPTPMLSPSREDMMCRGRRARLRGPKMEGGTQRSGNGLQRTMSRDPGTAEGSGRTACRGLIMGDRAHKRGSREGMTDARGGMKDESISSIKRLSGTRCQARILG